MQARAAVLFAGTLLAACSRLLKYDNNWQSNCSCYIMLWQSTQWTCIVLYSDNQDRWTPFCVISMWWRRVLCVKILYRSTWVVIIRREVKTEIWFIFRTFQTHYCCYITFVCFFFPTYENNVLMRVFHLYKLFDLYQAWAPLLAHLSHSHRSPRGFVILLLLYSRSKEHIIYLPIRLFGKS